MVALLTPDRAAIASMLVPSIPRPANSSGAASRTLSCASLLLGLAEFARLIGRRRHHAALICLTADHYSFAAQRGIVQFFHGDEESVHVDMEDGSAVRRHFSHYSC